MHFLQGGEEFVALLPDTVGLDALVEVAARLFSNGSLGVTVLGPDTGGLSLPPDRLDLA